MRRVNIESAIDASQKAMAAFHPARPKRGLAANIAVGFPTILH